MTIPQKKINAIEASWRLAKFKSFRQGGLLHKVDPKTVKKCVEGIEWGCDIDLVKEGVAYQKKLVATKQTHIIKSVENEVKEEFDYEMEKKKVRDSVLMGSAEVVQAARDIVTSGTKLYSTKDGEEVIPLSANDVLNAQKAMDLALISSENAPRHAKQEINLNQNQLTGVQGDLFSANIDGFYNDNPKTIEQRDIS